MCSVLTRSRKTFSLDWWFRHLCTGSDTSETVGLQLPHISTLRPWRHNLTLIRFVWLYAPPFSDNESFPAGPFTYPVPSFDDLVCPRIPGSVGRSDHTLTCEMSKTALISFTWNHVRLDSLSDWRLHLTSDPLTARYVHRLRLRVLFDPEQLA